MRVLCLPAGNSCWIIAALCDGRSANIRKTQEQVTSNRWGMTEHQVLHVQSRTRHYRPCLQHANIRRNLCENNFLRLFNVSPSLKKRCCRQPPHNRQQPRFKRTAQNPYANLPHCYEKARTGTANILITPPTPCLSFYPTGRM